MGPLRSIHVLDRTGRQIKCPHCQVEIHAAFSPTIIGGGLSMGHEKARLPGFSGGGEIDVDVYFRVDHMACPAPACRRPILMLLKQTSRSKQMEQIAWIYPRRPMRARAPVEVPNDLASDFNEAALVLGDSPQSSAALSRRYLQALLALQGHTQHKLAGAIDAVLATKALRSDLADDLDSIRKIGNFAAHPMKDTNTGMILPVEAHEAEWNLEVLEGLFDFYYVAPAKAKAKRDALNAKLQAAGEGPMKKP